MNFITPVVLKDLPINEWLTLVEKQIRSTLAQLLAQAVNDSNKFKSEKIDQHAYMEWIDKYQAQLIVLAAQISWSEATDAALQVRKWKSRNSS